MIVVTQSGLTFTVRCAVIDEAARVAALLSSVAPETCACGRFRERGRERCCSACPIGHDPDCAARQAREALLPGPSY